MRPYTICQHTICSKKKNLLWIWICICVILSIHSMAENRFTFNFSCSVCISIILFIVSSTFSPLPPFLPLKDHIHTSSFSLYYLYSSFSYRYLVLASPTSLTIFVSAIYFTYFQLFSVVVRVSVIFILRRVGLSCIVNTHTHTQHPHT